MTDPHWLPLPEDEAVYAHFRAVTSTTPLTLPPAPEPPPVIPSTLAAEAGLVLAGKLARRDSDAE